MVKHSSTRNQQLISKVRLEQCHDTRHPRMLNTVVQKQTPDTAQSQHSKSDNAQTRYHQPHTKASLEDRIFVLDVHNHTRNRVTHLCDVQRKCHRGPTGFDSFPDAS